jgi:cyanate permease
MARCNGSPIRSLLGFSCRRRFLPRNVSQILLPLNLVNISSPRWLVEQGRPEAARKSLGWLRHHTSNHYSIWNEVEEIQNDIERHKTALQSWTMLFSHRPLFNRLWRAALLHFMGQMCGNTSMKYYLPSILISLGLSRKAALLTGGIEATIKIAMTVFESWIIDKAGRRPTLVIACVIMGFALFVSTLSPLSLAC